ncbi:nitroreductase family protein [Thermodesulfobacteriota bacterium]
MDYEGFLELVKKRRSIRNFKKDPIPDEYVDKIIEAARWAPSGFNMQPWEFVVVKNEGLKDSIVKFINDQVAMIRGMEAARESWQGPKPKGGSLPPMGFANAPVFIIPFGDTRTRVALPMIHRFSDESWNKTFTSTLANTFLYLHLGATTLGLASQWVSAVTQPMAHFQIKQLLGIPMAFQIYDMMALGYADMELKPKMMREREEIVHHDSCGEDDFRSDEEVKDFIYKFRNPGAGPRD